MSPPTLVFSHANGFPAGTYRVLFERWRAAGWRVEAVEKFGHDPRWPVSSNWPRLREELAHFIDALKLDGPPVLVGHSLGGFLSLLTASHRSDLARAIVLLDSPLIAGWRAQSLRLAKATRLIHRLSPARVAERRRQHWPSEEACRAHYAAKSVFANWDARVLDHYVAAGTEPDPQGGVRLAFDRSTESRIYDTLPHHLGEVLRRRPLQCPVGFIGGNHSRELRAVGLEATRRLTHGRIRILQGGHLFPMERPEQAADEVLDLIAELTSRP
ncbi:MAG: alpha/beta hydrolase [Burkholderiaceae bacterium]|nr:alpha/beta hydrolase [Burkholderiaceae bacterium]